MTRKLKLRIHKILIFTSICTVPLLLFWGGYTTWNLSDPKNTCAQCHEVAPSHAEWVNSAHAGVKCIECHGTALSNGIHSIKEKTGMMVTHIKGEKRNEDIYLTEDQRLEIVNRCIACHRAEHAGWLAGGHAVSYKEIFMDSNHNTMEKPYWDCFRCHGMFYDGNIHDLMSLDSEHPTDWHIKDKKQENKPTITCLSCHQIHTPNPVSEKYISMTDTIKSAIPRNPKTAIYLRAEKMHLRSDYLTPVTLKDGAEKVNMALDPNTLLCMQCHSPNYAHAAGTEDDRTPVGVHEGISCIACHKPHSGETRQSCMECHPSLTQKEIDRVYANPHKTLPSAKSP